jgi:drug/metabolite transporter (DMT)-like permease
MLAVASSVIWAVFWIVNMYDKNRNEEVKLFISFAVATAFTFILMAMTGNLPIINIKGIAASAYIGAFEMGITFVLWLKALNSATNTARLSNFSYLVPFIALVFVNLVLHEKIVWTTIAGLLLIVGAIMFQQLFTKNEVKNDPL